MHRSTCALLLAVSCGGVALAACADITDEESLDEARPYDVPYLTQSIFAPSCGTTQCHSKFRAAADLVFDNPDDVRASLLAEASGPLLSFDGERYDPAPIDGARPNLLVWLTEIDPFGLGIGRMPFDAPLPDRDVDLLTVWIRAPRFAADGTTVVSPGGSAAGAQCNPNRHGGFACNLNNKVVCNSDWNFDTVVTEECSSCALSDDGVVCTP